MPFQKKNKIIPRGNFYWRPHIETVEEPGYYHINIASQTKLRSPLQNSI